VFLWLVLLAEKVKYLKCSSGYSMTTAKIFLFGKPITPEHVSPILVNNVSCNYTLYTPAYHNQSLFRVWCIQQIGVERPRRAYGFSVYENGSIVLPSKDLRFKGTHKMHFRQKEWEECYFETMDKLTNFISTCSL